MTPTVSVAAPERHLPSAEASFEAIDFASRLLESLAEEVGDHSVVGGQALRRVAAAAGADVWISDAATAGMRAGLDPHAVLALAVETGRDALPPATLAALDESSARAANELREHMAEAPDEAEDLFYWFRVLVRDVAEAVPVPQRAALARWAAAFASAVERVS